MNVRLNSLLGLLALVVPTGTILILYPILVRHISAAELGIWFTATSLAGSFGLLDFGLAAATVKFISYDLSCNARQRAAETLATSVLFYGALGALISIVVYSVSPLVIPFFKIDQRTSTTAVVVFRLSSLQFFASFINSVLVAFFKGCGKFQYSTALVCLTTFAMYTCSAAVVAFGGGGIIQVAAIGVGAQFLAVLFGVIMSLRLSARLRLPLRSARPSAQSFRRMFRFGSVMAVHSVCVTVFNQGQRLLVGILLGPAAVTTYTLAASGTSKAHAAVAAVTEVLFPLASQLSGAQRLKRVYRSMQMAGAGIALVLLLPLAIYAAPILRFWLGNATLAATVAPLVPIFALAFFFVSLSAAPFHLLNGRGQPWFNVAFDLINVLTVAAATVYFASTGLTISKMVWAFSLAHIVNSLLYQASVEFFVLRRPDFALPNLAAGPLTNAGDELTPFDDTPIGVSLP